MEQVKPRLLLVVPMLHQGGFERVCVRTARILRNDFEVTIAMFSDADPSLEALQEYGIVPDEETPQHWQKKGGV